MRSLLRLFQVSLLLIATGWSAAPASAQRATELVEWQARTGALGEQLGVELTAEIAEGWKLYATDSPRPSRGVTIKFESVPSGLAGDGLILQSPPRESYDPNFKMDVRYFLREATFGSVFDIETPEGLNGEEIRGEVTFQICNDDIGLCLPPTPVPFAATIDLQRPISSAVFRTAGTAPPPSGQPSTSRGGATGFLLIAFGAGLAALLTPCVFPMIPLTVSYFAKHSANRSQAVRMSIVYGLSIVVLFTALGLVLAIIVGAAGAQSVAANPWVNLFIASVLVFFALSLLGLFELELPSGVVNFMNRQGTERAGYLGVLFMGFTLTLVSFSCTAPFVGGLLAAASMGSWMDPLLGMLAFSTAFAFPFVLLALFPNALHSLPRSGSWMNAVKVVLGFVELAAALKFLSNADLIWGWDIVSRPLTIAVTIVIFFLAGLYLLGKLPLASEEVPASIGVVRLLFAVLFMGLSIYMIPGLLGAPLNALDAYLPPRQVNDVSLIAGFGARDASMAGLDEGWIQDSIEEAFAEGERLSKPVFVDFTGYTCTNCRQMEANVFVRPQVADRFKDFVLLRLYTDGLEKGNEFQRYQLQLTGTVALPTYAIVEPHSRTLVARRSGVMSVDQFLGFLNSGIGEVEGLASR